MEKANTARMEQSMIKSIDLNMEEVLDSEKAGALFGVSSWAMYKRAKNGQVPYHKMGRKIYFIKSELMLTIRQM